MKTMLSLRITIAVFAFVILPSALYAQATCLTALDLTYTSCHTGDLQDAANAAPAGNCGGATSTTTFGVWYKFTAGATTATISLSNLGTSLSTSSTYIEVFNPGVCGSLTSRNCQNAASTMNLSSLVIGSEYYIRIYVVSAPTGTPTNKRGFTITFQQSPVNDACSSAIPLTHSTTCNPIKGTLSKATSSNPVVASTCGTPGGDVWYSFTAAATNSTITLNNIGSSFSSTYIQLLSGPCGTFTPIACVNGTSLTATGLTIGATYYVRIYSLTAAPVNCSWNFDICVTYVPPPANDDCTGAINLTSATSCANTTGSLYFATPSAGVSSSCVSGTHYDVWYTFTALSAIQTITLSGLGGGITNPEIQLYSGSCGSLTLIVCGTTSIAASTLTTGNTYYVRVSNVGAVPTSNTTSNFSICVVNIPPPANDNCANVITLTSNTSCTNTPGTVAGANPSVSAVPSSTCTGTTGADVWYKFVAQSVHVNITLGSIGSSLSTAGASIQLLTGTCGNFTSIACISGTTTSLSLNTSTLAGTRLEIGNTYYIRIYTPTTAPTIGTWTYNICISEVSARIDYSRSYINITKGTNGGTVDVGDTLEMRATFVIRAKTVDSLSFIDTLYNTKGMRLVPGSIALRTNEGKIYGNTIGTTPSVFTDVFDSDAGWSSTNGADTVIRINFGTGASNFKRGSLTNTSKPSVFGTTCIIMATYRVVVYAPYDTKVNFKTGALTYRDQATDAAGTVNKVTFRPSQFIVYKSPGLCPNAVSASNALGAEYNGTFGEPFGTAPLARNRGTTPYTTYSYAPFTAIGGPNDYYYSIANNTSARYTTLNTWAKPDPNDPDGSNGPLSPYRLFALWDITGDHTKASNTAQGNPACDTTKPISASNPCGYMLVVNSAYKADTAFTYTVNNLCPNTYYELSAWFKNICSKCGCDSMGISSTTAGYIPTATNDSSGVRPNIAFDVNGYDYYTTGDILYSGTYAAGSDASNKWVKRGFTYLTGPAETSFTLTIRNNAPGGGGNDWAMDDISVATCLPNMQYSPTLSPVICANNTIKIYDTVRSYFNNYTYFKWQRSSDNGNTWVDVANQSGSATPVQNSTGWQYITSYTIPPASTTNANSGDKYRVTVATTSSNLSNNDCQFTDGVSIINLTVLNNCSALPTNILTFNGTLVNGHANLTWTTSHEDERLQYSIEKSTDGVQFTRIGILKSYVPSAGQNRYTFTDSTLLNGRAWYRIAMINQQNRTLYSRSIALNYELETFAVTNVVNPFDNDLLFDVVLSQNAKITATLYTLSGTRIKQQSFTAYKGTNGLSMSNLKSMAKGMYLLQVQNGDKTINRKVVK